MWSVLLGWVMGKMNRVVSWEGMGVLVVCRSMFFIVFFFFRKAVIIV